MRYLAYMCILFFLFSCSSSERVKLEGYKDDSSIIYKTKNADLFFSKTDVENFCKKNIGDENDIGYRQLEEYISRYNSRNIIIHDSLGKINRINDLGVLQRVRDRNHEYAYLTESFELIAAALLEEGKAKVYSNQKEDFVEYIRVERVNSTSYSYVEFYQMNDSLIIGYMIRMN